MYTCIRIIGTDIDYIPYQERKRSCIHVYGLHTMAGEGSGHVYVYTDYIPWQERKRSCIHIYGLHTMPGEGSGHVYMYTDYRYRFCLCFYTFLIKFKNCSEGVACC